MRSIEIIDIIKTYRDVLIMDKSNSDEIKIKLDTLEYIYQKINRKLMEEDEHAEKYKKWLETA